MLDHTRGWQIFGRVQGVGFRYFVQRIASSLGIQGWVRNNADGSVEVLGRGSGNSLDQLELRLERGPSMANVERIETIDVDDGDVGSDGFEIRY